MDSFEECFAAAKKKYPQVNEALLRPVVQIYFNADSFSKKVCTDEVFQRQWVQSF
jgi:hypothetical protein